MNELIRVDFEEPSLVKLSNSGIRIIKDRTLLAPGFWNGRNYTKEEITNAFNRTNWEDKDVISLVADHRDDDSKGRPLTIRDWLGFVSNQRLREDGYLIGDLNLCDSDLSIRLIDGKAPFGISPFVQGKYDKLTNSQRDFVFKNFAVVVEPACKESYINEYLEDDKLNEEIKELSIPERVKKKIENNVKLSDNLSNEIDRMELDSQSSEDDTNVLKGGKKMTEDKLNDEKVEQVEEVKEPETTEENKESEEPEKVEEETEDKLVEQIAKLTDKLMKKRKMTPEMAKMQKLESELVSLKKVIQKLQEEKPEEKEEPKEEDSEKLSAKPMSRMVSAPSDDEFKGLFNKGNSPGTVEAAQKLSSLFNL